MSEALAKGVAALVAADADVVAAEEALSSAKAARRELQEQVLPALFAAEGVSAVDVANGARAMLSTVATGSMPKDPAVREAAMTWLIEEGYADLVKTEVVAAWGKGHRDDAVAVYQRLRGDNTASVSMDESVHSGTLGKLVKDRLADGLPTPTELLGITVMPVVKLTKKGTRNE
jgi:hypothetical protein